MHTSQYKTLRMAVYHVLIITITVVPMPFFFYATSTIIQTTTLIEIDKIWQFFSFHRFHPITAKNCLENIGPCRSHIQTLIVRRYREI